MENDGKQQIKIKYVIPDNMHDCYVNGAYGGISQRGEIHIHFYSERVPIPKSVTYTIDEQNKTLVQNGEAYDFGGDVLRLIQSSIVMDINTAISIRDWLDDKIKVINKERKESQEEESSETE